MSISFSSNLNQSSKDSKQHQENEMKIISPTKTTNQINAMNTINTTNQTNEMNAINSHSSPIKFSDVFGTKADYSKGLFYFGRRKYLSSENNFEPPLILKTRQQANKSMYQLNTLNNTSNDMNSHTLSSPIQYAGNQLANQSNVNQFKLNFHKRESLSNIHINKNNSNSHDNHKHMKSYQSSNRIVTLQKFSSTNPNDWIEEFYAGCQIWVNKSTGEVSDECPWLSSLDFQYKSPSNSSSAATLLTDLYSHDENDDLIHDIHDINSQQELGTGALVYDSKPVDELFQLLDSYK